MRNGFASRLTLVRNRRRPERLLLISAMINSLLVMMIGRYTHNNPIAGAAEIEDASR
ncbi:MAG: hypothetical protein JXQ73_12325 [Phycisphaerae bacterium]|nr:hypothetical protein [Phycisphaerae bacterium]